MHGLRGLARPTSRWCTGTLAALGGGAGGQARERGTPRGDSEEEVPTTGICDRDSCEEIPEVSGTVSCPEVTVNSELVVLTSIMMEKGCG